MVVTINQPASFYQQPPSTAPNLIGSKPGMDLPNQVPVEYLIPHEEAKDDLAPETVFSGGTEEAKVRGATGSKIGKGVGKAKSNRMDIDGDDGGFEVSNRAREQQQAFENQRKMQEDLRNPDMTANAFRQIDER